jgi:hypothetical protein
MISVCDLLEVKEGGFNREEIKLIKKYGGLKACRDRIGLKENSGYGRLPEGVNVKDVYWQALYGRFDNQTAPVNDPRIVMGYLDGVEGWERENLGRRLGLEWK